MREIESGAGSRRVHWLCLNVSFGALAGRFNIPLSLPQHRQTFARRFPDEFGIGG